MDIDYYKAMGLETPADDADDNDNPAAGDDDPGETDHAVETDPADNADDSANGKDDSSDGDNTEEGNSKQSGGEDKSAAAKGAARKPAVDGANKGTSTKPAEGMPDVKFRDSAAVAAARRRAEAEAGVRFDKQIKDLGLVNPYTNTPITNGKELDDYRSQKAQQDTRDTEQQLANAGISGDALNRIIAEHPAVKAAQNAAAAFEAEKQETQHAAVRAELESDMQKIVSLGLEPDIKSLEDLPKIKNYDKFREYVKKGNNIVDAYKLVNYDALTKRASDAAAQKTRSDTAGKDHLNRTGQRGTGSMPVPADIKKEFRALNPKATDAEINAYYNKYIAAKK